MKKLIGLLAVTSLLTISTSVLAERGEGRRGPGKGVMKELNLTTEQKEKMKEMREAHKGPQKESKEEIKKLREEMDKALDSNASNTELKSIHNKMKANTAKKIDARFDKLLKMKSILTAQQFKKFRELNKDKRGKRGHRGPRD